MVRSNTEWRRACDASRRRSMARRVEAEERMPWLGIVAFFAAFTGLLVLIEVTV